MVIDESSCWWKEKAFRENLFPVNTASAFILNKTQARGEGYDAECYIEDKKTKVKFKFKFQVDKFCCCWQQFPMSWPLSLNLRISFGLKQTSLIDAWWWVCVGVRLEWPMRGQEQHLPANQKSPHESCIGEARVLTIW